MNMNMNMNISRPTSCELDHIQSRNVVDVLEVVPDVKTERKTKAQIIAMWRDDARRLRYEADAIGPASGTPGLAQIISTVRKDARADQLEQCASELEMHLAQN